MLFVNWNDFDISSVWESSKKIPVWIKYGERGKVKGAKFIYRLWGRGPLFLGGNFSFFSGRGGWISFRYKVVNASNKVYFK